MRARRASAVQYIPGSHECHSRTRVQNYASCGYRVDEWGVRARPGESFFAATAIPPLAGVQSADEIHAYPRPDPDRFDFASVTESCRQLHEDYVTYGGWWSPFFHQACAMVGFERFLIGMHESPDIIHALIGHIVEFDLEMNRRYLDAAQGCLDILYVGNDFGTQDALFMSPKMFEQFMTPALQRFYELAHDCGVKVMQHSCGAISEVIRPLIARGMDILDPIQVTAAGMAFEGLVNRFEGTGLCLHGAIDTQHLLPNATPARIAESVRAYVQIARGRVPYIVTGSQVYTEDIPAENILAIYRTVAGDAI